MTELKHFKWWQSLSYNMKEHYFNLWCRSVGHINGRSVKTITIEEVRKVYDYIEECKHQNALI